MVCAAFLGLLVSSGKTPLNTESKNSIFYSPTQMKAGQKTANKGELENESSGECV